MPDSKIRHLTEDQALERIVETVKRAPTAAAPFALVLGSGFSHGLVPTARELVEESLPLWVKSDDQESYEQLRGKPATERNQIARAFWKDFVKQNEKLEIQLDSRTGLPEDYAAAYRAAFSPDYVGGVGEPAHAREFQRALMRLDQPRLNAAHFLLASLLGVQPGKTRRNELFKTRSAFSRLILTTNFDPFLQTALQAVNRLYFMSDTPELGVGDEILDDSADAIHLVYLHGSTHRRSQAASDEDIRALKKRNAQTLAPALKRHGVIVLGYSGWDDAIVEALAACDRFDHLLYWCGRNPDPLARGAFGPRVLNILQNTSASYVNIRGAGHFMAQLCVRLVVGLPRLLENPIGQLREMLQTIDLKELEPFATSSSPGSPPHLLDDHSNADAIVMARKSTIDRLSQAEKSFLNPSAPQPRDSVGTPQRAPQQRKANRTLELSATSVSQIVSSARAAGALGNYEESIRLYSAALNIGSRQPHKRVALLNARGRAFYFAGRFDEAQLDWTAIVETSEAPVEQMAQALVNRGVTWGQKGDTDNELADYTRVIDQLPGAPVDQVAQALFNRGATWGQKGETDKALADYTRVIDQLPGGSVDQVAQALVNRGVTWGQKGEMDKALADHTKVIDQLPGAPVDQVAQALGNRGWVYYKQGRYSSFLADTEAALRKDPGLVFATFNIGLALLTCGRDSEATAAYKHAAEQFPDKIQTFGLEDLSEAQQYWLSEDRARPIVQLLESLKK